MCRRLLVVALFATLVLAVGLLAPAAVFAQSHGVTIQKVCTAEPRTCTSNADCSDNNACNGLETCDLSIPNTTVCHITITNADGFNDSITVKNAFDVVKPFALDQVIIPNLTIESVSGNTTCVVGGQPLLATPGTWCVIGPNTGSGAGSVTFISNSYVPLPTDPDPLPDQGTVVVADNCDAPGTLNCNTSNAQVSFSAESNLVSGCVPGTPLDCNDNNACTTDSCDPINGCANAPIVCNDNNACTTDTCDPVNGCVATPIVCNDNNACTTDTCDPVNGCQTTPIVCNDNNACTTDTCDPVNGCVATPIVCNDNNACTTDTCDPVNGCQTTPIVCNDNNACTTDTCDPVNGCQTTPIVCNDNNACTTDTCDPTNGCVATPISCDDQDVCTLDSCDPVNGCQHAPDPACQGCVTRTAGFWGTHPDIATCFLPVDSCGLTIDSFGEVAQDLCQSGIDAKANSTSPQQLQLIRQCTAAALNIAASVNEGGSCDARLGDIGAKFGIQGDLFDVCCGDGATGLCEQQKTGAQISASKCIEAIDAFNQDSNTVNGFTDFCPGTLNCTDGSTLVTTAPCKADSSFCQAANGDGVVNPGRTLGPK